MNNRYNLTPILIEEYALKYLFINKEATALEIHKSMNEDPNVEFEHTVPKVTQVLSKSMFFGCYKNKNRVNIYFIEKEVLQQIAKDD